MERSLRHPMPFELFDSPLQQQWKRDRARRQRILLPEAWRGCLGLAAALHVHENHVYHVGKRMLLPTEHIRWLCLRDVPAHHFPGSNSMNKREVNYVSTVQASLHYGTPVLNFNIPSRDAWDFRFMPFGSFLRTYGSSGSELIEAAGDILNADRFPRDFAILNELSARMTEFAFCGIRRDGRPFRRPWFPKRPTSAEAFSVAPPADWMPTPYLCFPAHLREQLYQLATKASQGCTCFECPRCRGVLTHQALLCQSVKMFEDGNFIAACTRCKGFRKWYLDDGFRASSGRHFSLPFRQGFCDAVAEGLPLRATEPMRYLGASSDKEGTGPDLTGHQFISLVDGRQISLYLPRSARLYTFADDELPPGQESHIPAGALFGRALGDLPPDAWKRINLQRRWATLCGVCGGKGYVGQLQRIWFDQQLLAHPCQGDQILVPAALVTNVVRDHRPTGLWWDFSPAARCLDHETQAFIFPPVQLNHWDKLRLTMPGEVDLDAGIADRRFSATGSSIRARHPVAAWLR